jgi:hypothetical protein
MKAFRLLLLFSAAVLAGMFTASAQNLGYTGTWTLQPGSYPACPSGTTATSGSNCVYQTSVTDTTVTPNLLLCAGVGLTATCTAHGVIPPATWPVFTFHAVVYDTQVFIGSVLTDFRAPALQVENLATVLAPGPPTAPAGSVTSN